MRDKDKTKEQLINELKEMRQQIRESVKERAIELTAEKEVQKTSRIDLQQYLDHLLTFNGLLDPDGTVIMANQTAVQATGLPYDEVVGQHFADAYWWSYDPQAQKRVRALIERAVKGETAITEEKARMAESDVMIQLRALEKIN